jgi:hypothetical protein
MDNSDKILSYLDGDIDSVNEDSLFRSLADDTALRKEMLEHINLEKAAAADVATAIPPSSVADALFKNSLFATAASGFRKAVLPVSTFILGILLTWGAFENFSKADTPATIAEAVKPGTPIIERVIVKDTVEAIKYVKSYIVPAVEKSTGNEFAETIETEQPPLKVVPKEFYAISTADVSPQNSVLAASSLERESMPNINTDFSSGYERKTDTSRTKKYSVTLSNISPFYSQAIPGELEHKSDSPLFNKSIGLHYEFSDRFSLGMIVGQERFLLKFDSENAQRINLFYRFPQMLWGGFRAEYDLLAYGNHGINARMLLGGCEAGAIGKIGLAYNYKPDFSPIGIFFETDASGMFYRFDGNIEVSDKYGFNIGIKYDF